MNGDLVLRCPTCAAPALADDEFCESCGAALGDQRDRARHHFELDAVTVAGVSDRGLVHHRNEDALYVEAAADGAVAVVCDGVSASASYCGWLILARSISATKTSLTQVVILGLPRTRRLPVPDPP